MINTLGSYHLNLDQNIKAVSYTHLDVLLIDTLTALFAVSLSLKFPKSMVQFL